MALERVIGDLDRTIERLLEEQPARLVGEEIGEITRIGNGIVELRGLPGVGAQELVQFSDGSLGIALSLEPARVGVVLLEASGGLAAGGEVRRTGRVVDVPVGPGLLGRVVDGAGRPLDGRGRVETAERWAIEREAPPIMARAPVTRPLHTGVKVVDALIPIGRGQRQLILGDRQTGKTALALGTIINQSADDLVCIYCAIGQRGSSVARVIETLRSSHAMGHCVVVVGAGEDPPGLQYITPYAATTIGEFFLAEGRDVLVVYDDLTRHANAYRELSLLLRRAPGREAYPGDIFYIHSRLLERSTHLRTEHGGGSLTALPVVETQAENLSAYIPTNLISITDGQVYLSPELFQKGMLPAIDVGRSVSRVGGKAQLPAYRKVSGALRLAYSQFEELETFARFGTRLDAQTRATIERGQRVREVFKQGENERLSPSEQVAVLSAVSRGLFDAVPIDAVRGVEVRLLNATRDPLAELSRRIDSGNGLSDSDLETIMEAARSALPDPGPRADAKP